MAKLAGAQAFSVRKRDRVISLPEVGELRVKSTDVAQKLASSRLSLRLHGDLLGMASGAQGGSPEQPVGQPTQERINQANMSDVDYVSVDILTPSGQPTGVKVRRFKDPLEKARDLRWISEDQFQAGQRFLSVLYGAQLEPRLISTMEKSVDGSRSSNISEHRETCRKQVFMALAAIRNEKYRLPFLTWTSSMLSRDVGIADFGGAFSKSLYKGAQRAKGKVVLGEILSDLAKHFGLK